MPRPFTLVTGRFPLPLTPARRRWLAQEAKRTGATVSAVIIRLIDEAKK